MRYLMHYQNTPSCMHCTICINYGHACPINFATIIDQIYFFKINNIMVMLGFV